MRLPIYLDNHATTRTDPQVVEAMLPYFTEHYGNAASVSHRFGWEAEEAVERAREQVARAIGAESREIIFTSGATESNNLAIKGLGQSALRRGNHLVTASSEHKAVLDPMKRLARQGWDVTIVDCDEFGGVSADAVAEALTDQTVLVSVMAANNEVGTINPIGEIGRLCHERGIVFHTDAAQAVGKVPDRRPARPGRPPQPLGTQDLRAKGDRRVVRPSSRSPGAAPAVVRWRRPRAGLPERDARGPADRRARERPSRWRSAGSPRNREGFSSCASGSMRGWRDGCRASGSMATPPIACRAI